MASLSSASGSSRRSRGNESIGDFVIGAEIGKGSFAQVYLGRHTKTGEAVAVKSVELGKLNRKLKDNLRSEIQILEKLRHPHIVALHQCLESSTHINLVMEYCELGDLSLFIKKRDKHITNPMTHDMARKYPCVPNAGLNEVVTRHFLKQLASALQFLRAKNLVHRDVKPQNLLLLPPRSYRETNRGMPPILAASDDSLTPVAGLASMPMLKLADFGFARVLPSTSLAETLCGSPLYMAPEILRYEKYDAKADLWSVGTVLYEMVSGKPPFRANNHVELLRKIEAAEDVIRFPRESPATPELKAVVRALLKRNPVERVSFENFFANTVVTADIPGLVEDDLPKPTRKTSTREVRPPSRVEEAEPANTGQPRRLSIINRYKTPEAAQQATQVPPSPRERRPSPLSSPPEGRPSSYISSRSPREGGQEGLGIRPASRTSIRPSLTDRPRRPSTPSSLHTHTRRPSSTTKTEDKASQDVAFERDYVVINKNQVEMNALADEFAAGGKVEKSPQSTQIVSRSTGPGRISTQQGLRASSYDKNMAGSPTSFITKAIHDASMRLFGIKNPHPFLGRSGTSPPQGYSPFPAFPTAPATAGLIGDGKTGGPIDEDTRVAQRIEDHATHSDVVYGFAEVKYKQLVPLAPSMEHGLSGVPAHELAVDDDGLTVDAILTLSEEAFVLYMKSLSLLANAMNIAGLWWSRKTRTDPGSSAQQIASQSEANRRINGAVQWIRNRFNEVLEKTELSRMKLQDAQKQLPPDHPNHPSKHGTEPPSPSGSVVENVFVTPGITAGKLMYERAIEMSRSAAINEVTNVDLDGCELSYITAIRMLEAVLDTDEPLSQRRPSTTSQKDEKIAPSRDQPPSEIDTDDQQSVQQVMKMVAARLLEVQKKKMLIASAERAEKQLRVVARKRSGDVTPRSVRSQTSS